MAKLATLLAVAGLGAHGARKTQSTASAATKFILGDVPILNYHRAFENQPSLAERAWEEDWVVVMTPDATEEQIHMLCSLGNCLAEGHPRQGGVPYFEVKATEKELTLLLGGANDIVKFVEPDGALDLEPDVIEPQATSKMWGLERVGTSERTSTGAGTHIYVVDTGIRKTHDDFGGRVIPALDKTRMFSSVCVSWSPVGCAEDNNGHGSHTAGTAGGATYGVAPGATLHAVKVLPDQGSGKYSWAYDALDWIATKGLRPAVASMSLSAQGNFEAMTVAVNTAVDAGVIVVVSGGNSNTDACGYSPAFVPNAITVGSTTPEDARSSFSNFGSCVNIWAPGSRIVSASHTLDDGYSTKSGTSMACPHVSGAAALLLEKNPDMNSAKVLSMLLSNALDGVLSGLKGDDSNKLLQVGN